MLARVSGWVHAFRARVDALFHAGRLDRELQEELRFHLEHEVAKHVRAGMSLGDAEREARRGLGNAGGVQEQHRDARGLRWLDELHSDLRHGARRLLDRPWISVAAVLTLAVGIGSVTTIYGAVVALVLDPLPIVAIDEVVVVGEQQKGRAWTGETWTHPAEYAAWRREQIFAAVGGLRPWFVTMTGTTEPVETIGYQVFGDYFQVLGIDAALGRTLAPEAGVGGEPEVVLSYRFWRRHFDADEDVVGRTVRFRNRERVIVGVMPQQAGYPMGTDVWASPDAPLVESQPSERRNIRVIARLSHDVSLDQARAAIRYVGERTAALDPAGHEELAVFVEPLRSALSYGTRPLLAFLMAAAACVQLLVCANVANLQLMSGPARRSEMALRTALGARRTRLVRQLLTESLALALVGGALAVAFAHWGSGFLRLGLHGDWWRFFFVGVHNIGVNAQVLIFSLAVSLTSVLAFGLLPALRVSRVDLSTELKQGLRAAASRGPRGALVVIEVVLSVVLVSGALLMARAGASVGVADLGLNDDIATFVVRPRSQAYRDPAVLRSLIEDALIRVRATPGIDSAATSSSMPGIAPGRGTGLQVEGAGQRGEVNIRLISDAYFSTLAVGLFAGREFDAKDDVAAPRVAVLSQTVADRLGTDSSGIGRQVRLEGEDDWLTVVGIAPDIASAWNDPSPLPALYVPAAQRPPRHMVFLMRAAPGAPEMARESIWQQHPDVPLPASRSVAEMFAEQGAPLHMASSLMQAFAAVALLICLGGIYALVGYVASLREREVGVRMAIGADRLAVERLFVGRGIRLACIGLLIGLPTGRLFATLLARTLGRFSPSTFIVSELPFLALGLAVLALTALASYLPARRAAGIDPATVLRSE